GGCRSVGANNGRGEISRERVPRSISYYLHDDQPYVWTRFGMAGTQGSVICVHSAILRLSRGVDRRKGGTPAELQRFRADRSVCISQWRDQHCDSGGDLGRGGEP